MEIKEKERRELQEKIKKIKMIQRMKIEILIINQIVILY